MFSIEENYKNGYILDPTIRWEKSLEQATDVHQEKYNRYIGKISEYEKCYPNVKKTYFWPLFGAREVISKFTVNI